MLIDTHCHLDAAEFDADRDALIAAANLSAIVVPAVEADLFDQVQTLAWSQSRVAYALGIHPMYVHKAHEGDLDRLEAALERHRDDPKLVAVGEIGLDFFVPEIRDGAPRDKQIRFYEAQLRLARKFSLPVILHVRRSQDVILKSLRQIVVPGGIAHAFNGSEQQAQGFVSLGFCLGFGGAMTYPRALQIRRLAAGLDETAIVLETDAPDIAPVWLQAVRPESPDAPESSSGKASSPRPAVRNTPSQLHRIAETLAGLRGQSLEAVCAFSSANALRVLPRLAALVKN